MQDRFRLAPTIKSHRVVHGFDRRLPVLRGGHGEAGHGVLGPVVLLDDPDPGDGVGALEVDQVGGGSDPCRLGGGDRKRTGRCLLHRRDDSEVRSEVTKQHAFIFFVRR